MLIHATITVTGEKDALASCEARLRRLLSSQFLKDEISEHHGPTALCYDLKIEGGIPFPAFAQASQEFPGLEFAAEWVNVAAGEKGHATLVGGRLTAQARERLATLAGDGHPVYVEVAPEGRLALALTLVRASRDEWRGYCVTATRDALVRLLRSPESGAAELYATDGSAEWAFAWRGALAARALTREELRPPLEIDPALFQELDRLAQDFAAAWIWFAAEGDEEIAVERSRYARYGYAVAAANVRTSRLHRMRADAGEGARLVHSTLGADDLWAKDLILATWAATD